MQTYTYKIKGMHCASCSSLIERTFKKVEGVQSAEVNYGTEKARVSFDPSKTNPQALSSKIEPLGYSIIMPTVDDTSTSADDNTAQAGIDQSKKEKLAEIASQKNLVMSAIPLTIITIFIMTWDILTQFELIAPPPHDVAEFFHNLLPIMATYVLFVVGKPYLLGMYRFFRYGKANMDTLIGLGTSVAFLYSFIVVALEGPLKQFINTSHTPLMKKVG